MAAECEDRAGEGMTAVRLGLGVLVVCNIADPDAGTGVGIGDSSRGVAMATRFALRLARLGPERTKAPRGGGTSSLLGLASFMASEELPAAVVLRTEVSTTEAFEAVES